MKIKCKCGYPLEFKLFKLEKGAKCPKCGHSMLPKGFKADFIMVAAALPALLLANVLRPIIAANFTETLALFGTLGITLVTYFIAVFGAMWYQIRKHQKSV